MTPWRADLPPPCPSPSEDGQRKHNGLGAQLEQRLGGGNRFRTQMWGERCARLQHKRVKDGRCWEDVLGPGCGPRCQTEEFGIFLPSIGSYCRYVREGSGKLTEAILLLK